MIFRDFRRVRPREYHRVYNATSEVQYLYVILLSPHIFYYSYFSSCYFVYLYYNFKRLYCKYHNFNKYVTFST